MNPNTAKDIIAETHYPNHYMHKIITLVYHLPIHIFRRNGIDKYIIMFEDTCGGFEHLFSSSIPVLYTCHTARFLTVWVLHMGYSLFAMWKVLPIVCVFFNISVTNCTFKTLA